jgi:predicted dehydrogenase
VTVHIGLVGLGMIGPQHLRSLSHLPDAKVVGVADLVEERLQTAAEHYGVRTYSGWQALLEGEPSLEALVLATPALVRLEPIQAICERKLALFCEKPPAFKLDTALQISQQIKRAGIINAVGFHYRWFPLAQRMQTLIGGRPCLFARIVYARPLLSWVKEKKVSPAFYRKESFGGPLIDHAIHLQDLLRYITQDEPVIVQAMAELGQTQPREGRDSEETTQVMARHASGMLSTHVHNLSYPGSIFQLQIVGSGFDLTWDLNENQRLFGVVENRPVTEEASVDAHFEEMRGFVEAVNLRDQGLIRSSYEDACRSLAVCDAAVSALVKQVPVVVPPLLV